MSESKKPFDCWAIVEIMGHLRIAGKVSEETIAGAGFIRVDVPTTEGQPGYTRYFAPGSLYSMSPTTEEIAIAMAERLRPVPAQAYEIAKPAPPRIAAAYEDDL